MQWVTAQLIAEKLSLSDRTVRDWCMRDRSLAHKEGHTWRVNIRRLAETHGIDLVDLLLLLQNPEPGLIKAAELARRAGIPRRTVAHWCRTRPDFAIRIGVVWFVDLSRLDVTLAEIVSRRRNEQDTDSEGVE